MNKKCRVVFPYIIQIHKLIHGARCANHIYPGFMLQRPMVKDMEIVQYFYQTNGGVYLVEIKPSQRSVLIMKSKCTDI